MTDLRQAAQQALEALEVATTPLAKDRQEVLRAQAALRERLAQPEQKPVAWGVFDGQNLHDVNFTEEDAQEMVRLKGDGSVVKPLYTSTQPRMQPCAGRNCGSTNQNLHSAECFEDYEKTTGMNQWIGLTDEEVVDLKMFGRDLEFASMTALRRFARDIEATLKERNHD